MRGVLKDHFPRSGSLEPTWESGLENPAGEGLRINGQITSQLVHEWARTLGLHRLGSRNLQGGKQHIRYVSLGRKTARWEVLGKVCFVSLGSCHSGIISVLLQLPHSLSSPLFSLPPPLKDLSLELRGKYRYSLWKYKKNLISQKEVSNKLNTKNNFLSWALPSASCFYRKSGVLITHL